MQPNTYPKVYTAREYDPEELRALRLNGVLDQIRRGSYRGRLDAEDSFERDRQELLARCVAVAGDLTTTFAFSHTTAAALRRWPVTFDPSVVDIVQRTKQTRSGLVRDGRHDIRRHHRPDLTDADITWLDGLPLTTDSRTVLDGICSLSPRSGLVLADEAFRVLGDMSRFRRPESLEREAILRAEWEAELADLGPVRGVRRAREVLRFATGFAESPGESKSRWLALVAGLPEPICQWEVWVDGKQYFSDMAWLTDGDDPFREPITFEYDGVDKYGTTAAAVMAAVAEEKERESAIRSTGAQVHRITKERLARTDRAIPWMLAKFPPSVRRDLTPRPRLRTYGH